MKNEPLTLDELLQMDGKPVWAEGSFVQEGDEDASSIPLNCWVLIYVKRENPADFIVISASQRILGSDLVGRCGVKFYRNPPAAHFSITACDILPYPEKSGKAARHRALCERIHAIYTRKNHDYGDSFHETFQTWGLAAAGVRMSDKLNRFIALSKTAAEVPDESISDTLLDLANYAIMTVLEMEEKE